MPRYDIAFSLNKAIVIEANSPKGNLFRDGAYAPSLYGALPHTPLSLRITR